MIWNEKYIIRGSFAGWSLFLRVPDGEGDSYGLMYLYHKTYQTRSEAFAKAGAHPLD